MIARRAGGDPPLSFELPSGPGTYILVLMVFWESVVEVGALGEQTFEPGFWLYCGSALGPGGLAARVAHHTRFAERPRWHIDYLRFAGTPAEVWYARSGDSLECEWAGILSGIVGATRGPLGFGSSDCGCSSHLFHAPRLDIFEEFSRLAAGVERVEAVRSDR